MGNLINIDNGGTLTDICVINDDKIYHTKTLTTPHDLSRCFFDGLSKASKVIYGKENLHQLMLDTQHIRYSTTQGTNALVERSGPRLGVIATGSAEGLPEASGADESALFNSLVGDRVRRVDAALVGGDLEAAIVSAVNTLTSEGANRIVVAHSGAERIEVERNLKNILLKKYPQHLLGSVPILYSHEVANDSNDRRRLWTSLFNAFLHPAMEQFLYHAEHKLRNYNAKNPLLIFRNDGGAARVAKTTAVMTYSSGPRGGMEGVRALAAHYDFNHVLSMDVGGTTTDIGEVKNNAVRSHENGFIEGVEASFPLSDITSVGVGGSSIIKVVDGKIQVGPQSVGSEPGPACFGLGGVEATITDAFLVLGILNPATFFGGELNIDLERAKNAISKNVAAPLGLSIEKAAAAMEDAWVGKIAESLLKFTKVTEDTVLSAFGGAGPFVVCKVAKRVGINRVIIPGLAPVFSAYGVGFSDIVHQYDAQLTENTKVALESAVADLTTRAERGMFAEGVAFNECEVEKSLAITKKGVVSKLDLSNGNLPKKILSENASLLSLRARKKLPHPEHRGMFGGDTGKASRAGTRTVVFDGKNIEVPVYAVDKERSVIATGPAILEDEFYTCRIDDGWSFEINSSGDILLVNG